MSSIFSTVPPLSVSICGLLGFANSLLFRKFCTDFTAHKFCNFRMLCSYVFFLHLFAGKEGGQLWRILPPARIGVEVAHSMPLLSLFFLSPLSFFLSRAHSTNIPSSSILSTKGRRKRCCLHTKDPPRLSEWTTPLSPKWPLLSRFHPLSHKNGHSPLPTPAPSKQAKNLFPNPKDLLRKPTIVPAEET